MVMERINQLTKFERKFTPEPNSGCWLWTGNTQPNGYGKVTMNKRNVYSHRASWLIHRGEIPEGLCVLHKCDTRCCVNPDHLFLGTKRDNTLDSYKKGRQPLREEKVQSKITQSQAREIRTMEGTHAKIAAVFGISRSLVSMIREGKLWKEKE